MAESGGSTRRAAAAADFEAAQQQHSQATESNNRARSLGRSRSRGRTPASELLARKQRLLESSGHLHEISWSSNNGAQDNADADQDEEISSRSSLRPQVRRARRPDSMESKQQQAPTGEAGESRQQSVEAKLESLSEFLKQQQQQQTDQLTSATTNNEVPHTPTSAKSIDDVYILLAKKEKDLQLAAELGKVLLEKNDELSKANERITEDYSHKLELLEQDKHKLKRKLDQLDGEYENRLIELQTDCNILKNQLDEQQQLARQVEKEKSKLIDDLVQQNQRLTSELVEATKSEELLSSQLEQMNERFNSRLSNRQDHDAQLEALKEEIQIVNQRKQDLERRLKLANSDKGNLNAALDESGDKLVLLENLLNEKDGKLGELLDEVNELRDSSLWLSSELEAMISANERLANSAGLGLDGSEAAQALLASHERKRSQLIDKLKELRLKNRSRLKANELILINRLNDTAALDKSSNNKIGSGPTTGWPNSRRPTKQNGARRRRKGQHSSLFDEIESSNEGSSSGANRSSGSANEDESLSDDAGDDDDHDDELNDAREARQTAWKEETAIEIYTLLCRFQLALQARKDGLASSPASSSSAPSLVVAATLLDTSPRSQEKRNSNGFHAQQPAGQQHLYSPNSTDDSGISGDDIDKTTNGEQAQQAKDPAQWRRLLASLGSLIEEMPCSTCHLMIAERADYEQLQKLHSKLLDEMRREKDQLLALNVVKTEQETKLAALEERCAFLSEDLSNCDKPKEEIVKLAWKARDEAVERKNSAEISLAKTRIENMQIASQLMEVVQQKGELSQKLAQFEDDIHYITQDSVKAKFTWEEYAEKLRRSKTPQPDSTTISNPLAQLLNFSVSTNANSTSANGGKSSATENITSTTAQLSTGLMRNFTSNRFNLRFWQRSNSSEKAEDNNANNKGVSDHINRGSSATSVTTERRAS